ncbi:hypothetical protein SCHIN_v1c10820 [Spiroplasma chinense]|uniref:Lipoprotein n=1 Tax=Spiroplasma chinense TaxID=216932 RepID=A0A5B9Y5Z9_9MOLU|nr:lipoprotein [Spiroplasma chinense]QEH62275.1 hypothetical protein SCHIN_v1c10820 [Spiroplasma chinense]
MKKILTLLSSITLVSASTASVVACGNGNKNTDIVIQANPASLDVYQKAAAAVNAKFEEAGVKFRAKIKESHMYENYVQISNKGVRDKSIPDVFIVDAFKYQLYKDQNNILNVSDLVKKYLLQTSDDEEHFGLKKTDSGIEITQGVPSARAWKAARINSGAEEYFGVVPSAIETISMMFDNNKFGITDDGHFTGSVLENEAVKAAVGENPIASLENMAIINEAMGYKPTGYLKALKGYFVAAAFNAMVKKHDADINPVEGSAKATIWQKTGEFPSQNYKDFDSLWENEKTKDDAKLVMDMMVRLGYSFGKPMRNALYNQVGDEAIDNATVASLRDGTTSMAALEIFNLQSYASFMKQADPKADIRVKDISSLKFDNSEGSPSLSSSAGGHGFAIKSTIANVSEKTKDGENLTKAGAAMLAIKELSDPKYSADFSITDGKYSPFKANKEAAVEQFNKTEGYGFYADAANEIAKGYEGVTDMPNTALDQASGTTWDTYRLAMNTSKNDTEWKAMADQFWTQFTDKWAKDKAEFIWG